MKEVKMKKLGCYQNGNYQVTIFDDGTKIRENDFDWFTPEYPESMDIKITNFCDRGCPWCHENSAPDGTHGDILNSKFIDTLHPYTELAIGGGNPLSHPDLVPFLLKCKTLKLIPSMTVNQEHFVKEFDLIQKLAEQKLIYGIGVSLTGVNDDLIQKLRALPNSVLHVIAGVVSVDDLRRLYDYDLKLLILGYKVFRRGKDYYSDSVAKRKKNLYALLLELIKHFQVVSFDNLAVCQLDVKRLMTDKEWKEFYMGNDGQFTMYIDLVKREFAKSSTATERYPLLEDIKPMFKKVRREAV